MKVLATGCTGNILGSVTKNGTHICFSHRCYMLVVVHNEIIPTLRNTKAPTGRSQERDRITKG